MTKYYITSDGSIYLLNPTTDQKIDKIDQKEDQKDPKTV